MKRDPYEHKEKYYAWKIAVKDGVPGISKINSDLTLRYVGDMEVGRNVSSRSPKGPRSFIRLNTLRQKMIFFSKRFKAEFGIDDITQITEDQIIVFFSKIRTGEVAREDGKIYASIDTYGKGFKSFWHWWVKVNRKEGITIEDITIDLDVRRDKPKWVYLTEDQVRTFCDNSMFKYRVMIMFLFDTGIRAPTELINIKISDFHNEFKEVHIRDEISKTFGRRIKLMLSSDLIKRYVKEEKLEPHDYLFTFKPYNVNRVIKNTAKKLFGDGVSPAGEKYCNMTMYDFRHCACCYWLPRYKSESALKYRFGWKKSDKIHYYSELLGMRDTISEEDMLIDTTKTELEKDLDSTKRQNEILQERIELMEIQMAKFEKIAVQIEGVVRP
ncbi:MAG: tyrosine-type recombinase/integrase [Candidatus Zapsychrus exili]|nr:tyrosine-type recombinase/integrase [Candidatus Zapsychrus exili]